MKLTYQSCKTPAKPRSSMRGSVLGALTGTTFITQTNLFSSSIAAFRPPYRAFMSMTLRTMLNGGVGSSSPGLLGWSEKIIGESKDQ